MRLIIQNDYEKMSVWAARYIAKKIKDFKPVKYESNADNFKNRIKEYINKI